MSVPLDEPLSLSVTTWAVPTDSIQAGTIAHTYGEMHDIMHRDIAIGNDFRKERIKLLITLATGVFALMISFNRDLFAGHTAGPALLALLIGFLFLLGSVLCGIYHFKAWEDFYLAHRGLSMGLWRYRTAAGDQARRAAGTKEHNQARNETKRFSADYKQWDFWQTRTLLLGLFFVVVYVGIQASQPAPKAEPATTGPASVSTGAK